MKLKFSSVNNTPGSKFLSISVIKSTVCFLTLSDTLLYLLDVWSWFRLPLNCRHKLSTSSFAVVDDSEATILQTGSDCLSLGSSLKFCFSFETGTRCKHFFLVLRQGKLVMFATNFGTSCSSKCVDSLALHSVFVHRKRKGCL